MLKQKNTTICPVCQTPWEQTPNGSQEQTIVFLNQSISSLSKLITSDSDFNGSLGNVKLNLQLLETGLTEVSSYAKIVSLSDISTAANEFHATISHYQQTLDNVEKNQDDILNVLASCEKLISETIPAALLTLKIEDTQASTEAIDSIILHLQSLQEAITRLKELTALRNSIRAVEEEFNKIADRIRNETNKVANNAVDALKKDVKEIYKKIHPGEAVPNVHIKINADDKILTIRVNFHSEERLVPPGGYLSEAQINTLGLALFLSSVRLFNKDFPFVFLDDIVSSYDAESRANIVDVLAEDMDGFQIILTTHDERFYTHLKSRLESENWVFERISGYDFERGPRRESDNLRPDQIDLLIKGDSEKIAGNAVRQFMEDWFDSHCEKFSVYTLHRKGIREYRRTLFDYWEPFIERLKSAKADFGNYVLESQSYKRLNADLEAVINYYSHNQTNPYEWGAMEDIQHVWMAFQGFTKLFVCANCKRIVQFHFSDRKFYCTCGGSILPPIETREKAD